ncbi:hypothetical protein [Sphingomonas sp.]|uniref:hypothetical protein n=1 Tax=Sphingomonas sp. TaxID=28214 RepID=UPI0031E3F746
MCYGIQFTDHAHHEYALHHIFDCVCDENGIEHRLIKVNHPWTNGQSPPGDGRGRTDEPHHQETIITSS